MEIEIKNESTQNGDPGEASVRKTVQAVGEQGVEAVAPAGESSAGEDSRQAHAADYLDQLQRLQAEFMNYRKRVEREKDSLHHHLIGQVLKDVLPVVDDLERLLRMHAGRGTCDIEGVRLIHQKLQHVLKSRGVEEIESMGQPFDPEWHEAVGIEHTDGDHAGRVLDEWEKGYRIGGRLLRPSRVKVGKKREARAGDFH
jgi:molecular chaperone GrpE